MPHFNDCDFGAPFFIIVNSIPSTGWTSPHLSLSLAGQVNLALNGLKKELYVQFGLIKSDKTGTRWGPGGALHLGTISQPPLTLIVNNTRPNSFKLLIHLDPPLQGRILINLSTKQQRLDRRIVVLAIIARFSVICACRRKKEYSNQKKSIMCPVLILCAISVCVYIFISPCGVFSPHLGIIHPVYGQQLRAKPSNMQIVNQRNVHLLDVVVL